MAAFAGDRVLLSNESCLEHADFSMGGIIPLSGGTGPSDYPIVGSSKSRAMDAEVVISATDTAFNFGASGYGLLAYTAADLGAIVAQIQGLLGGVSNWNRTVEEFNRDTLSAIGVFL